MAGTSQSSQDWAYLAQGWGLGYALCLPLQVALPMDPPSFSPIMPFTLLWHALGTELSQHSASTAGRLCNIHVPVLLPGQPSNQIHNAGVPYGTFATVLSDARALHRINTKLGLRSEKNKSSGPNFRQLDK